MLAGRGRREWKKKPFYKRAIQCYQLVKRGHFERESPNGNKETYESNVAFHAATTHGGVCRE